MVSQNDNGGIFPVFSIASDQRFCGGVRIRRFNCLIQGLGELSNSSGGLFSRNIVKVVSCLNHPMYCSGPGCEIRVINYIRAMSEVRLGFHQPSVPLWVSVSVVERPLLYEAVLLLAVVTPRAPGVGPSAGLLVIIATGVVVAWIITIVVITVMVWINAGRTGPEGAPIIPGVHRPIPALGQMARLLLPAKSGNIRIGGGAVPVSGGAAI